jgi:predicted alpha/beta superfamily hydrolase
MNKTLLKIRRSLNRRVSSCHTINFRMKNFLILGAICLFFPIEFFSQSLSSPCDTAMVSIAEVKKIHSKELDEERTLNIYVPYGYLEDSTARYNVIYLLDGSAHEDFVHITGLVDFLSTYGIIPPSIVVGIANVDRKRDFTFPTSVEADKKEFPTTGGSEKFMAFIENELLSWVDKNYRTNSNRLLIGQSLGGLLACEILLKKPDLFSEYIIVSPSLWWDNQSLLTKAPALLQNNINPSRKICISVGSEGDEMEIPARKMHELTKDIYDSQFIYLPEENHATILHRSVYRSLELLYSPK